MPYLLLGLALLVGGLLLASWFSKAEPKQIAAVIRWGVIGTATVVIVYLAIVGRTQFLAMLPLLALMAWRMKPLLERLVRGLSGGGSSGSQVRTRFFAMRLDHESGHVDGEVLEGAFAGRRLSELNMAELLALRRDVSGDPQSLALIEAYLDRRDPGWRGGEGGGRDGGGREGGGREGGGQAAGASSGGMTREEAYHVLGLEPGASAEEIRGAHRRLMQKLHPDAGGSDWLAAKLNAAKDLLLSGR